MLWYLSQKFENRILCKNQTFRNMQNEDNEVLLSTLKRGKMTDLSIINILRKSFLHSNQHFLN